jgi:aminoglycoside phosphotransferase (APT) family kinase protein
MASFGNVETSMAPPGGQRVPQRPEELDVAWLTACLRHAGVLEGAQRVAAIEVVRVGQGKGFAGQIARVSLQYDPPDAPAPARLIAKFSSEHAPTREMLGSFDGYAREVRFYRELAAEIGVGTPRCYFAHHDQAEGRCCLLLEDLAPAASVDRAEGFSFEQAKLVLEQLAVLHARFWNRTEQLPWLRLSDELFLQVIARFVAALPSFTAQFGGTYPTLARAGQLLMPFFGRGDVTAQARRPPLTLAHNDVHGDNVFLPTAEGGRFALIDWQSLAVGRHGTADVARLLCGSLRTEVRRKHASELLAHYHRALCAQGVRGYSLRALRFRYRQELLGAVTIAVLAFGSLDFGEHADDAPRLMAERIEAALRDANVIPLLYVFGLWYRFLGALRGLFTGRSRKQLPP